MFSAYAPHMGEELWEKLGKSPSVSKQPWPAWEEELTIDDEITIAVQVNGKLRAGFTATPDSGNDVLQETALSLEKVQKFTQGKKVIKVIVVPGKLVNIVVKG